MEVPIDLLTIALGDHGLQGRRRLLKGGARLCSVATEFMQAKAEVEKGIAVGVQVVAELRGKGRRVGRKHAIPPDYCARLAARNKTAAKTGGRRFCDVGCDCLRRG